MISETTEVIYSVNAHNFKIKLTNYYQYNKTLNILKNTDMFNNISNRRNFIDRVHIYKIDYAKAIQLTNKPLTQLRLVDRNHGTKISNPVLYYFKNFKPYKADFNNYEEIKILLDTMGWDLSYSYEIKSKRFINEDGSILISLDETPVGYYINIECKSLYKIQKIVPQLFELYYEDALFKSYPEIFKDVFADKKELYF